MTDKVQGDSLFTKDFFSKVSHYTRSPFNGLLGFSELLLVNQQRLSQSDTTEYLLRINMLAKRAFLSAESLIVLLKIAHNEIHPQSVNILFSLVVDHCMNLHREGLQLKNVELAAEVETGFAMDGDAYLVNCLFANLISKAVKLCSDDSRITLTAKNGKGKKSIKIHYDGMIIEQETVRSFFEDKKKVQSGAIFSPELDLELWISYHLAVLSGMTLQMNFSETKGSTFSMEI